MNYVIILAAGNSSRLKEFKKPKQFLKLSKNITVLEKTISNFCINNINHILVVTHKSWEQDTKLIINKIKKQYQINIDFCFGGNNRNISLKNGLLWLDKNKKLNSKDIILTHDSARVFTDKKTILSNINLAKKYGACTTIINSKDTISEINNNFISKVLNRDICVIQQTPQTFNWKIAKLTYLKLNDKLLEQFTDACGLLKNQKLKIAFVQGNINNFKITNLLDLKLAQLLISN